MARASLFRQVATLLRRNALLKWRNKKSTLQELISPIYFVGILALLKGLISSETLPVIPDFPEINLNQSQFQIRGGLIFAAPNNSNVENIIQKVVNSFPISNRPAYRLYPSLDAALDDYKANDSAVSAGIEFDLSNPPSYNYELRFPYEGIASSTTLQRSPGQCRQADGLDAYNCDANTYLFSGFANLQKIVEDILMKEMTGQSSLNAPDMKVQKMPMFEFTAPFSWLQTLASIYMVMAYAPFITVLLTNLVLEKEKRIKEAMRMMGMRDSAFWLSWTLIYVVFILIVTCIVVLIAALAQFFQRSNMFLFFLMLFLYGMSVINIAFMLTPFFSRSQTAGPIASFMTMIFSLLYLAVSLTRAGYNDDGPVSSIPEWGQWLMCLLSPVALALAVDQGLYLDIAKGGMTFETIGIGQFPLYASLTMLAVDTVLYGLLAVYLDNVFPNDYGLQRPPWFFLTKSYWFPKSEVTADELQKFASDNDAEAAYDADPNVEPVPAGFANRDVLRINDVHKVFKSQGKQVKAVNGLSLKMYEGHITALLGHNGAGKTTLINILTGMTAPTSGSASIYGFDVRNSSDMSAIRSMTGVCPQHDVLFEDLTCTEHLAFYGSIKGVESSVLDRQITRSLEDVGLTEQKDHFSKQLSGGQKRKLSVAIALIGDPKVIFLDEPTAGMDPASRRHLWSLLKARQKGKVILLTTHFMDEADILADRKAIISKGKLKCCGSSLYLKNKFGIGYHMSLLVEPSVDLDALTDLVVSYVPDGEMHRQHGKEVVFTLPLASVDRFKDLFGDLDGKVGEETKASSLGVKSYGISMTTMEEVFLKLGHEDEADGEDNAGFEDRNGDAHNAEPEGIKIEQIMAKQPVCGRALWKQQFWAMVKVRFIAIYRIPIRVFFQIFLPLAFVVSGAAVVMTSPTVVSNQPSPLTMMPNLYVKTPESSDKPNLLYKTVAEGQPFINSVGSSGIGLQNYTDMSSIAAFPPHNLGLDVQSFRNTSALHSAMTLLYNTTAPHALAIALNMITNTLLTMVGASGNVTLTSRPWPRLSQALTEFSGSAFGGTILLGMAMSFIPPSFAMVEVRMRVTKVKSLLRISGVRMNCYWAAAAFIDTIHISFIAVMAIIIMLAFQIESLLQPGAMISLILLFFFYIPVNMLIAYNLSFLFKKIETSESALPNVFLWVSFIPFIVVATLDMTGVRNAATIVHYVFSILDPPYAIYGGLYYIDRVLLITRITQGPNAKPSMGDYFAWNSHIPITYVAPIFHAVWLYFLLRFMEINTTGGDPRDVCFCGEGDVMVGHVKEENSDIPGEEDSDVRTERENISAYTPSTDGPVLVAKGLRKEFQIGSGAYCGKKKSNLKIAVRNNNFQVNEGEVFGLLGPNGAGKTTTLNMVIAEEGPTCGKVYVDGSDVRSSLSAAFKAMGYCPQHDCLWPVVTLKEHLETYCKCRGLHPADIPVVIHYLLDALHINEHADKRSEALSGGTKRKLSYAISMLGTPKIVLMDEPSTGMDPRSKRFLWDTISASFEGTDRGAILTTHYMEEADALCSRIGIMINGEMQCLGSSQHLKNKYGSGYMLEVKGISESDANKQEEMMDSIDEFITSRFPNATCSEWFGDRAIYKVPRDDISSLGLAFASLESGKKECNIEEYSLSQASLEQVFLEFARNQVEEGAEESPGVNNQGSRRTSSPRRVAPLSANENGPETLGENGHF